MSSFYETKVVITSEQAKEIEQQSRDQASSAEWKSEGRKMITASKVGGICKMRKKQKEVESTRIIVQFILGEEVHTIWIRNGSYYYKATVYNSSPTEQSS